MSVEKSLVLRRLGVGGSEPVIATLQRSQRIPEGERCPITAPTTRKNGSFPVEFQQNSVDFISWLGTLDYDQFQHKSLDSRIG